VKTVKLSKTSWVFLAVIALLLAAAIPGWIYSQKFDEQQQITLRLNQTRNTLSSIKTDDLVAKQEQYQQQFVQYKFQIEETRSKMSFSQDSIDAIETILADAKTCKVDITTISTSGFSTENLSGTQCETLPISINANGSLYYLSDFISNLSQIFPTSVIKTSTVNNAGSNNYTTSINLVIYNYRGN
jgi:type II secretory pathway pseudopilin PulG